MRKSSLILLLAMAFVLTTVAAGFSASTILSGPCQETCKHWGYNLKIDTNYNCDPQYQSATLCDQCPLLDYESAEGYCGSNGFGSYYNAAGIIFKICDCDNYSDELYDTNKSYGIKIEIMEPTSGIYFTNQNLSGVDYNCGTDCTGAPAGSGSSIYVSVIEDITVSGNECPSPCVDATVFSMNYKPLTDSEVLFDPANDVVAPDETCADALKSNLATDIISSCQLPFMITNKPYVMIDIPTMVFDPNALEEGQKVKVRVTIMDQDCTGVCPDCNELCSCLVEIGVIGCSGPTPPKYDRCTACFPYFTAIDTDGWWAAFALTNASDKDAKVLVKFTAGGTSIPYLMDVPANSVESRALGECGLAGLEGKGPIFAEVTGTIVNADGGTDRPNMTGFAIMGDNAQAYGYLSKQGMCGCREEIR